MNSIDVTGLTCDYGHGHGIFDLTFSVNAGEVFGFLGPNASGKTTTIRHLMGFARPASGSCQIEGRDCFTSASVIQQTLAIFPRYCAISGNERQGVCQLSRPLSRHEKPRQSQGTDRPL